ncbi:RNA polymerase sigma factor SigJ [Actinoplanes sp. URMC 104]|uniref:RNA polymerase sigma factor SigJ n=1 Tax=Actinoplanes sp. URMC 104 TaxID=3423409 RepID=UPI003F1C80EF
MAETAVFEQERKRMWGIAYRITGSVMDADDAVQEAWLRWRSRPDDEARNPQAYLTTVVTRICYDRLTSAQARREVYAGPWLPEPVVGTPPPEEQAALGESVSLALMLVLERLSPAERIAFVLHDVFDVPFPQIAEAVGRSAAAVRQLASRARRRVRAESPQQPGDRAEHRRAVDAFVRAVTSGDLDDLLRILDPEVVWRSDGGGIVQAVRFPVVGARRVANLVTGFARAYDPDGTRLRVCEVNGAPGVLLTDRTRDLTGVLGCTVDGGRVVALHLIVNPEKLRHVACHT